MSTQLITGVGRIVWGNPLQSRPKEKNGQKVLKDGVQVVEYTFGLAIPKGEFGELGGAMQVEATAVCPQGIPPDFSYKMKDGDTGLDKNGGPLNVKPGYAGHYVLALSTEYPIPVYRRNGATFEQMSSGVKTGDYVRVQLTINGHGRQPGVTGAKPGLYLNPNQVEFLGFGEEIRGSIDPNAAFGAAPAPALPPGASATPTVSAAAPFPGAPPAQPQQPAAPPTPHAGFPWGNS